MQASISTENYRPGFDISLPLFHKQHPELGGAPGLLLHNIFPVANKHFLAFKVAGTCTWFVTYNEERIAYQVFNYFLRGKRYVHGIGSDTRNSLHHLHNGQEVVMVTTCRHGKNWRQMMDERCEEDNEEYDRWDYQVNNKTTHTSPKMEFYYVSRTFLQTLRSAWCHAGGGWAASGSWRRCRRAACPWCSATPGSFPSPRCWTGTRLPSQWTRGSFCRSVQSVIAVSKTDKSSHQ